MEANRTIAALDEKRGWKNATAFRLVERGDLAAAALLLQEVEEEGQADRVTYYIRGLCLKAQNREYDAHQSFEMSADAGFAPAQFQFGKSCISLMARRSRSITEQKLWEDLSFVAGSDADQEVEINAAYVDDKLGALAVNEDLSRYVL